MGGGDFMTSDMIQFGILIFAGITVVIKLIELNDKNKK
jgi:hypothetical protein